MSVPAGRRRACIEKVLRQGRSAHLPALTVLHPPPPQVLRMADRLGVRRCIDAACAALAAAEPLDWEAAQSIWLLPPGCAADPTFKPAYDAAAAAVQARLGDIDAALSDPARREQLLSLPLPALTRLLASSDTRASSEPVAFWLCNEWLHANSAVNSYGSCRPGSRQGCCPCALHPLAAHQPSLLSQRCQPLPLGGFQANFQAGRHACGSACGAAAAAGGGGWH